MIFSLFNNFILSIVTFYTIARFVSANKFIPVIKILDITSKAEKNDPEI